jgi:hypothetical protein
MTRLIGYRCKCSNAFSQVVLIGREAYPFKFLNTDLIFSYRLTLSFFHFIFYAEIFSAIGLNFGGFSLGVTPLPIPNREVKPQHADGTACAGVWESRSLPRFILIPIFDRDFFCNTFFLCFGKKIFSIISNHRIQLYFNLHLSVYNLFK